MQTKPRVYVVDGDEASSGQVRTLVASMNAECVTFSTAEEFLVTYNGVDPGCLVAELFLSGMSGLELQAELARRGIRLPVIFLTSTPDLRPVVRAVRDGAVTVLEKPVDTHTLRTVIHKSLARDSDIRRIDARHLDIRTRLARLSPRECRVLRLLLEGKTNESMADELGMSPEAVRDCRRDIFEKTLTDSATQLLRLVTELHFGPDDSQRR